MSNVQEYESTTLIDASAEKVWAILTDGSAYREWNPEIIAIEGAIELGQRIIAHVRLGSGAVRKVKQRISVLVGPSRMEWVGGMPFGLFVGRRNYYLKKVPGGVEFRMHLHMSGPLLPLILKSVGDRQLEIDTFSAALQQRAETR